MTTILRDFKFGFRMLLKTPGHTAAAALALALGIGLTTTMFSIVDGVLMKGLPYEQSDRLMALVHENVERNQRQLPVYHPDFLDWQKRQTSFEGLAAFNATTVNLSGEGEEPERVDGAHISANWLDLLREKPFLGRGFLPGEDAPGAPGVAILGYGMWKTRYGGDPQVIGRTIRVNGEPSTVVGIMGPEFQFPFNQVVWAPLRPDAGNDKRGEGDGLLVFGRLKDGVTIEQAQAEMATISKALATEFKATNEGISANVKPYTEQFIGPEVTSLLLTMLGAVGLVLLLACANVASLMMARASLRTRELAIRSALGAGRRRVLSQILAESVLLSLFGSAFGIALAVWGTRAFTAAIAEETPPFWIQIGVDPRALVFALGVTLLAGLLSGLVPALQASKADVNEVLKDEGRGSTSLKMGKFSRLVVIGEVALSCALLVGAGLMVKSVVKIRTLDLGFETADMLTLRIALYEKDYPEQADRAAFWQELLPRLAEQPGVAAVAAVDALPTNGTEFVDYALEGRAYPTEKDYPRAHQASVSPGFFQAFGTRLLAGRDFGPQDREGSLPVAIVNQSLAREVWGNEDPIGRRFRLAGAGKVDEPWRTVIGVAPDLQMNGFGGQNEPEGSPVGFYLPVAQEAPPRVSVAVKARGNPLALTSLVREQVKAIDKDLPIYFVKSMDEVLSQNGFFFNLFGSLFALFGVSALVLAAVGIYGVIAFSVQQRTQEIGVRMALGAQPRNVLRLILRQGMRQLALGLAGGLVLAWGASRLLGDMLFQVQPSDPPTFVGVCVFLSAVAMAACWIPAHRAARVDPIVAIHND